MERDCMLAHGASRFTKERLLEVSDPFRIPVCKNCGTIVNTILECQKCKNDQIVYCNIPYASKLLSQILMTMGLKMNFIPEN